MFSSNGISYYKDEDSYKKGKRERVFLHFDVNFHIKHGPCECSMIFVSAAISVVVKAKS